MTRTRKEKCSNPTRTTHTFLIRKGKLYDVTGGMLTDPGTNPDCKPTLKGNQELYELLGITELHFLRKADIIRNLKPLIRTLIDWTDFNVQDETESLPKMFKKVKKGSKYKKIILRSKNTNWAPRKKIEKDWKISEKMEEKSFMRKLSASWKIQSYRPRSS